MCRSIGDKMWHPNALQRLYPFCKYRPEFFVPHDGNTPYFAGTDILIKIRDKIIIILFVFLCYRVGKVFSNMKPGYLLIHLHHVRPRDQRE